VAEAVADMWIRRSEDQAPSTQSRGGEAYGCRWRRWRPAPPGWWASYRSVMADRAGPHGTYGPLDDGASNAT
jgi:hypothetical protein